MIEDLELTTRLRKRLMLPAVIVFSVLLIGTIGYWLFWRDIGGTMFDGFFMAFTTITTIGYGEVKPLTTASRIFTI
ncbi:MAG: potassium channel family protein [Bacteroidota bacterium]